MVESPAKSVDLAVAAYDAGKFEEAETRCRTILSAAPTCAPALHLLAMLAAPNGQLEFAIDLVRRAVAADPTNARFRNTLGRFRQQAGEFDEALAAYRGALQLLPTSAELLNNLGQALAAAGRLNEAEAALREAIRQNPSSAPINNNLANLLRLQGRFEEALAAHAQAVELDPTYATAHSDCGNTLRAMARIDAAIAEYRKALQIQPDLADAWNNLGVALLDKGSADEAAEACREALRLLPNDPVTSGNLANCLRDLGLIDEAIEPYRRAWDGLGRDPTHSSEAAQIGSNLIFAKCFQPASTPSDLLAVAQEWDRRHARPLARFQRAHQNDRSPDRRLRIGYVSPDFREHAVGVNLLSLFEAHDRPDFEIFAYASVAVPDAKTDRFQALADGWRNIFGLPDEYAAELIRRDQIDILVDLAGHTAGNRLLVFARKPAPVQVTYLGLCTTTGMEAMDYRFSDPHLDPPEGDVSGYTEETIRLPNCTWCYQPARPMPDVSTLPVSASGYLTFISRNTFAKASEPALETWGGILTRTANSRLILTAPDGSACARVLRVLEKHGITPDRIEFAGRRDPWDSLVDSYARADIALDPFPYCGWITSCDALWMGLPVVTLRGRTVMGRGGCSTLANLGLSELIAQSPERYIEIAVSLANDLSRLTELRAGLRPRMQASPLRAPKALARDIELAYRQMWRRWCAGNSGK